MYAFLLARCRACARAFLLYVQEGVSQSNTTPHPTQLTFSDQQGKLNVGGPCAEEESPSETTTSLREAGVNRGIRC